MNHGQTVSIPQGNIISHLSSELLLAYIDCEIIKHIKVKKFEILRFRDDYKIFTNSKEDADNIIKIIARVLFDFNLSLNEKKTKIGIESLEYIVDREKVEYLKVRSVVNHTDETLDKLSLITNFSTTFPDSKMVRPLLYDFLNNYKLDIDKDSDIEVVLHVLSHIMRKNPRTYGIVARIFAEILESIKVRYDNKEICGFVKNFIDDSVESELMALWIQKAFAEVKLDNERFDQYKLLNAINSKGFIDCDDDGMWNFEGLSKKHKKIISNISIINDNLTDEWDEITLDSDY